MSTLAGVKMQVKRVLIMGLLLPIFISGVAFWLLYNQTNNKKQWESPRESSQAVTAGEHTYPLQPHPYISVRAFIMESCTTESPGGRIWPIYSPLWILCTSPQSQALLAWHWNSSQWTNEADKYFHIGYETIRYDGHTMSSLYSLPLCVCMCVYV